MVQVLHSATVAYFAWYRTCVGLYIARCLLRAACCMCCIWIIGVLWSRLTILSYRYEGLRREDFFNVMHELQESMWDEVCHRSTCVSHVPHLAETSGHRVLVSNRVPVLTGMSIPIRQKCLSPIPVAVTRRTNVVLQPICATAVPELQQAL